MPNYIRHPYNSAITFDLGGGLSRMAKREATCEKVLSASVSITIINFRRWRTRVKQAENDDEFVLSFVMIIQKCLALALQTKLKRFFQLWNGLAR